MIYERIMQIRSGQWEIGIIEDHLARPLTEDEMAKAIAKLNAEAEDAATPSGMQAIMAAHGHPGERPCVVCGHVFDAHNPGCVFDAALSANAG
jgi:hypothetical protein